MSTSQKNRLLKLLSNGKKNSAQLADMAGTMCMGLTAKNMMPGKKS